MDVVTSAPATPVLALIGLGVAFLLAMTRRSARRRRKHPAGPFPQIAPAAPAPSPGPAGTSPAAEHDVSPAGQAADVSADAPATPVLGLIALGVAVLLVTTRLFARRRRNRR